MATSGYSEVLVDKLFGAKTYLKFYWERISYSVSDNTSTIRWELIFYGVDGGFYSNNNAADPYSVTINGIHFSGTVNPHLAKNEVKSLASGTVVIPHNSDGTKTFSYSFSQKFSYYISPTKSGSGTGELDRIPRPATITAAPDFNDEGNPTITYSNPYGNDVDSLEACITFNGNLDDIPYREISKAGSSYTFNFTEDEKETMWEKISEGASMQVLFCLRTTIEGEYYYNTLTRTLTFVNYKPVLAPIVEDSNDKTFALTGNRNTLVKYASVPVFAVNATARKGAYIVSTQVTCGNQINDSETGDFTNIDSGEFYFTATDSRGDVVSQKITKTLIDYVKPTISVDTSTPTSIEEMKVTISGVAYPGSFGSVKNAVTLQYRYAAKNYPYGNWITATPTFDGNRYTFTLNLEVSDYRLGYNFQAKVSDKLYTVDALERTLKNLPIFDWGENDFNFNVPVSMTVGHINYSLYGLCRVLSETFEFDTTVYTGANYNSATCSATLAGNMLRCTFNAERSSATTAGNMSNEEVFTVSIAHGGTINEALFTSFVNSGNTNSSTNKNNVAAFYMSNVSYTEETLDFTVRLAASAFSTTTFRGYFIVPVTLNLSKFVDLE